MLQLVFVLVVVGVALYLLDAYIAEPIKKIIYVVVVLWAVLCLLDMAGIIVAPWVRPWR